MKKLILSAALALVSLAASAAGFDGIGLSGTATTYYTNQLRINLDGSATTNVIAFTNSTGVFGDTNGTHVAYVTASNLWFWKTNWASFVATNTANAPTGTWKTLAGGTTFGQSRYQPRSAGTITTTAPATPTVQNISADTSGNLTTTNVLASSAEVDTGTSSTKLLTPASLANATFGALSMGVIYVDAVSGSDTTGNGRARKPYATLTKAQTVATNGQTIFGVRGTFAETGLGKQGVAWYFNDGTWLTSPGTFYVGTTNGTTNLFIGGRVSTTNAIMASFGATNCTVAIDAKYASAGTSDGFFLDTDPGFSVTNKFYLTADIIELGGVRRHLASGVSSNDCNEYYVTARQTMTVKPEITAGYGNSNTLMVLTAPRIRAGSGAGSAFFSSSNTVQVTASWFTKISAVSTVGSYYWFNVGILSTNDLNTNLAGIKGVINVVR